MKNFREEYKNACQSVKPSQEVLDKLLIKMNAQQALNEQPKETEIEINKNVVVYENKNNSAKKPFIQFAKNIHSKDPHRFMMSIGSVAAALVVISSALMFSKLPKLDNNEKIVSENPNELLRTAGQDIEQNAMPDRSMNYYLDYAPNSAGTEPALDWSPIDSEQTKEIETLPVYKYTKINEKEQTKQIAKQFAVKTSKDNLVLHDDGRFVLNVKSASKDVLTSEQISSFAQAFLTKNQAYFNLTNPTIKVASESAENEAGAYIFDNQDGEPAESLLGFREYIFVSFDKDGNPVTIINNITSKEQISECSIISSQKAVELFHEGKAYRVSTPGSIPPEKTRQTGNVYLLYVSDNAKKVLIPVYYIEMLSAMVGDNVNGEVIGFAAVPAVDSQKLTEDEQKLLVNPFEKSSRHLIENKGWHNNYGAKPQEITYKLYEHKSADAVENLLYEQIVKFYDKDGSKTLSIPTVDIVEVVENKNELKVYANFFNITYGLFGDSLLDIDGTGKACVLTLDVKSVGALKTYSVKNFEIASDSDDYSKSVLKLCNNKKDIASKLTAITEDDYNQMDKALFNNICNYVYENKIDAKVYQCNYALVQIQKPQQKPTSSDTSSCPSSDIKPALPLAPTSSDTSSSPKVPLIVEQVPVDSKADVYIPQRNDADLIPHEFNPFLNEKVILGNAGNEFPIYTYKKIDVKQKAKAVEKTFSLTASTTEQNVYSTGYMSMVLNMYDNGAYSLVKKGLDETTRPILDATKYQELTTDFVKKYGEALNLKDVEIKVDTFEKEGKKLASRAFILNNQKGSPSAKLLGYRENIMLSFDETGKLIIFYNHQTEKNVVSVQKLIGDTAAISAYNTGKTLATATPPTVPFNKDENTIWIDYSRNICSSSYMNVVLQPVYYINGKDLSSIKDLARVPATNGGLWQFIKSKEPVPECKVTSSSTTSSELPAK